MHPQRNRRVVFWARAAHGVLSNLATEHGGQRLSLLVNWWTSKPRSAKSLDEHHIAHYGWSVSPSRPQQVISHTARQVRPQELGSHSDGQSQRIALQGVELAAFSMSLPPQVRRSGMWWFRTRGSCPTVSCPSPHWAYDLTQWDEFWGEFDAYEVMQALPQAKLVLLGDVNYAQGDWGSAGGQVDNVVAKYSERIVAVFPGKELSQKMVGVRLRLGDAAPCAAHVMPPPTAASAVPRTASGKVTAMD